MNGVESLNEKEKFEAVVSVYSKLPGLSFVLSVKDGVVTFPDMKGLQMGEIVFVCGVDGSVIRALVLNLYSTESQAILLGNERLVCEGSAIFGSGSLLLLDCGLSLFGRVLDGIGGRKDKKVGNEGEGFSSDFGLESTRFVEQKATGIIDREPVRIPLRTGIKAIDSLVPIGRGQRELIIGDRQTGKTAISVDTILNHVQMNEEAVCFRRHDSCIEDLRKVVWFVYNSIGQKQSTVNQLFSEIVKGGASWFTSIVAATAAESASLQFLAPYTACTIGEFVRDIVGGHCVVIFDDLSKHAVAYRQMSLLLRRPPGREAFPGDVFYVHSRLLERAGALASFKGGSVRGTLTALPIIETQAGDVSAYIPTNVISITDGQIFLETELFHKGIRPAINVGLSVSRVGSAAQPRLLKKIAGSLKMELAQFREIEGFAKLGASLDEVTKRLLVRGENLVEVLKQGLHKPLTTFEEIVSLFLGLGYNGNWLSSTRALRYKYFSKYSDHFKFESKIGKVGYNLFSFKRIAKSWFEIFRTSSTEFGLHLVSRFLDEFLEWLNRTGLVSVNSSTRVERVTDKFIQRFPMFMFDDLVVSFLKDRGSLTLAPGLMTPTLTQRSRIFMSIRKCRMFKVVLGGGYPKVRRIKRRISRNKFRFFTNDFCGTLVEECLYRPLLPYLHTNISLFAQLRKGIFLNKRGRKPAGFRKAWKKFCLNSLRITLRG